MKRKKLKRFFANPYIYLGIGIIGTAIVNRKYDWLTLKEILGYIKTVITFKVNIPVLVLFILAIPMVLLVINLFRNLSENVTEQIIPDFLNYVKDTFDGMTYEWQYRKNHDGKYEVTNLTQFCPKDSCQLVPRRPLRIDLECPYCEKVYIPHLTEVEIVALINKNIRDKYNLE